MSSRETTGRVRLQIYGKSHSATWRLVEGVVEVTSQFGVGTVKLGGLASAPSIAAGEKLREMARQATRPAASQTDRARFNIRDA